MKKKYVRKITRKNQIQNQTKTQKGITLLALVITIIVLLILAGITINAITGDNGIIRNAGKGKEETEIANEKDILEKVTVQAMGNNKYGNIEEQELQEQLDKETGEGKTEATDIGEEFEVLFKESNRYYTIDKDGNVGEAQEIIEDQNPGDITLGKNGETLDGSEEYPYEIWCIEDLVTFSNMVNGEGIRLENEETVEITTANNFGGKYVELKTSLNFKSKLSYQDSERIDFGDINGNVDDGNTLINEMITGTGFNPIGNYNNGLIRSFQGNFDGNGCEIRNLYKGAFFGSIQNAIIENLKVYGIENTNNTNGIIKRIDGSGETIIKNCYNYMNVYNESIRVGGIADYVNANVKFINCANFGNITGTNIGVGGIIGYYNIWQANLELYNTYNLGKIDFYKGGISYSGCGGLIGLVQNDDDNIIIKNCYNAGEITGKAVYIGGIIGNVGSSNLECTNVYNINDKYIGDSGTYTGNIITKTDMKNQEFVNELNSYKDENNQYPTEWKKWKLGENGYPTFE